MFVLIPNARSPALQVSTLPRPLGRSRLAFGHERLDQSPRQGQISDSLARGWGPPAKHSVGLSQQSCRRAALPSNSCRDPQQPATQTIGSNLAGNVLLRGRLFRSDLFQMRSLGANRGTWRVSRVTLHANMQLYKSLFGLHTANAVIAKPLCLLVLHSVVWDEGTVALLVIGCVTLVT